MNRPLGSRAIAVCDSIDAMTSDRPYRKAMGFDTCINEIIINSELMFDPVIVEYIVDNMCVVREFLKPKSTGF